MNRALFAAVLVVASACAKGDTFEDKPNASNIDETTSSWDDGPKPTPDPPLNPHEEDAGVDAGTDAGVDAGTDAGVDAGTDAG
jgi:hypothetical protein